MKKATSSTKRRKNTQLKSDNNNQPLHEDQFLTEDSPVIIENAMVSHPDDDVVFDELRELGGFQEWMRENRGYNLTFGDF